MFIDTAKIFVKAGDGGNGAVAFHREKYVASGGPDGGDGGNGGNVYFVADDNLNTLLDFKYKHKFAAQDGEKGQGKGCYGKGGDDLTIKVPMGTLIRDAETGKIVRDISGKEPVLVLKGGNGGWGNAHFATPTRQCPRFAKSGLKGQEREFLLELKLLSDVGLIGFPNVGKSTLLSVISAARPKIANYHFTTLSPNLGVVKAPDGNSFVVADIPGLIEGASEGEGLGHEFLRHVERCRLLVHLVDVSESEGRDCIEDFEMINRELTKYSAKLASLPQIVVGSKCDILSPDSDAAKKLSAHASELGCRYFNISAAANTGIKELVGAMYEGLSKLPKAEIFIPEINLDEELAKNSGREITITLKDGVYVVEGDWIMQTLGMVDYNDYESLQYMNKVLKSAGVNEKLEAFGVKEGDTVSIYGLQFEYIK